MERREGVRIEEAVHAFMEKHNRKAQVREENKKILEEKLRRGTWTKKRRHRLKTHRNASEQELPLSPRKRHRIEVELQRLENYDKNHLPFQSRVRLYRLRLLHYAKK